MEGRKKAWLEGYCRPQGAVVVAWTMVVTVELGGSM